MAPGDAEGTGYPHVGPVNLERTSSGLAGGNLKVTAVVLQSELLVIWKRGMGVLWSVMA
jgi:hypothetical protein